MRGMSESQIITTLGETLGFWVAGDDVAYETFESRHCAAEEILRLHDDSAEMLGKLWKKACGGRRGAKAAASFEGVGVEVALTGASYDTVATPLPVLSVL